MNIITSYWPFLLLALAAVLVVVLERKKIASVFTSAKASTTGTVKAEWSTVKSDADKVIGELKPHLESIASSLTALHAKTFPAAAAATGDGTTPPASEATVASGGTVPGADVVAAHAALDATIVKHSAIVTQAQAAKATLTAQTAQASKDALAVAEPEATKV